MPPVILPRAIHQEWTAGDRSGAVRLTASYGYLRVPSAALPIDPRASTDTELDRFRPASGT